MKRYFSISGLALCLAMLYAGCDFTGAADAFKDLNVLIELEPINTVVSGEFYDAGTGDLVEQQLNLTFSGQDAGTIVDIFSDPLPDQQVKGGITAFGIRNATVPSEGTPVQFKVTVKDPNGQYQSKTETVALDSVGTHVFRMRLVNNNRPPEGASAPAVATGQANASTGTSQPIVAQTAPPAAGQGTASVSIPAGTVMQTSTGQPLSGQVTTQVMYYDTDSEEAANAFPGGASAPVNTGGGESTGTIQPAGYTYINVQDGSGNQASQTNKPVDVAIGVSNTVRNPNTGVAYQAGDAIDVWGYDAATGIWTQAGSTTVQVTAGKSQGNLFGNFSFSGNLPNFAALGSLLPTCSSSNFNLTLNRNGNLGTVQMKLKVPNVPAITFDLPQGTNTLKLPDARLPQVPNVTANLEFIIPGHPQSPVRVDNVNSCSFNQTVTLPAPPPQTINTNFFLAIQCGGFDSNGDRHVLIASGLPTMSLKYRRANTTDPYVEISPIKQVKDKGQLKGIEFTVNGVQQGQTYKFRGQADDRSFDKDVTIDGTNMTFDFTFDTAESGYSDYCQ